MDILHNGLPPFFLYMSLIIIIALVFSCFETWYRLRHFRGPWLGVFSSVWMAKTAISGRMNLQYTEMNRKYGSLTRIGSNDLITDDPEVIRRMSSARSQYKRSNWYNSMSIDPYIHNVLSEPDVAKHDKLKSQMAAGYAGKENPTLEQDIDAQIESLISLIKQKYISSGSEFRPLDFGKVAQYLTMDVITQIAFGGAFGYLENDEDMHEYLKTTWETLPFLVFCSNVPVVQRFFSQAWVMKLVGPSPKDKNGIGKLMGHGIAQRVVRERYGPDKKERMDMLGAFVRHALSQRQAEPEVLLQIIAGSDTTATAIGSTFLRIITAPPVLTKLRVEVDAAAAAGAISSPITVTEAKNLPYLQACILERLRINPPFTGLLMKEVPVGGDFINGQFVPGGTKIGHSIWSVQRNSIVGSDAEMHRPERWLEADTEKRAQMEKVVDLVFGYGRWGCLGKQIALIELNKVFVEILCRFDFVVVDPTNPCFSINMNLWFQDRMWLRVTERGEGQGRPQFLGSGRPKGLCAEHCTAIALN